jgi:hypothetical protein
MKNPYVIMEIQQQGQRVMILKNNSEAPFLYRENVLHPISFKNLLLVLECVLVQNFNPSVILHFSKFLLIKVEDGKNQLPRLPVPKPLIFKDFSASATRNPYVVLPKQISFKFFEIFLRCFT